MARQAGMRVCRFQNCKHGKRVNINTEAFVKDNKSFYHEDCYKIKTDLQLFRDLWYKHISSTVVHSQLNQVLNQLVSQNVPSDYLLFVLQYVIDNHLSLRYPAGIRYYVDYPKIKEAYQKKKIANADFSIKNNGYKADFSIDDDAPTFSVKRKPSGFNKILRR